VYEGFPASNPKAKRNFFSLVENLSLTNRILIKGTAPHSHILYIELIPMTQEDWIELRKQLKSDPDKAFEPLYNKLWTKLFAVSFNYVRDKAVAQEIVQDVFVSLWIKRNRLEKVNDIMAFALRATRNRIYDHFDRQAVRDQYILSLSKSQGRPANSTQQQIEYEETFNIIDTEINMLPDTTRKVFRLSRFDKFNNEEIASHLNLSVKAVEYHITQALKQLRIKLKYIGIILMILFTLR